MDNAITLNEAKFNECIVKYLNHCENDKDWVKYELYKFRFSNWLNHKVNLRIQQANKIFETCKESMKQYYSPDHSKGVQFIQFGARREVSKPISLADVLIFKELATSDDYSIIETYNRGMSFTALTAWLGTLLPKKFICAPTSEFAFVINYLFDCELPKGGFPLFQQSINYHQIIRERLKQLIPASQYYFLDQINEFIEQLSPNATLKSKYSDADWNWVTEDFCLYILRIHLGILSKKGKKLIDNSKKSTQTHLNPVDFEYDEDDYQDEEEVYETSIESAQSENVDDIESLLNLDMKYNDATPEVKEVLSKRIERGAFAQKFKEIVGFKCMICEYLDKYPYTFRKENNDYYVEVHHVISVSKLQRGSLTSANLITVCPNHHRQLHYGKNTSLEAIDDYKFTFKLNGIPIIIKKNTALRAAINQF